MWRDHRTSINIRVITPIVLVSIIALVFYITSVAPRISQAFAPQFSIHNHSFIDTWYNHGGDLTISQNGHAHFVSRVYRWCVDGPAPCDTMNDNTIIPGIQEDIIFNREQGNTLYGTITSSTDHTNGKIITATLTANDMLSFNGQPLCGKKAPPGSCGA